MMSLRGRHCMMMLLLGVGVVVVGHHAVLMWVRLVRVGNLRGMLVMLRLRRRLLVVLVTAVRWSRRVWGLLLLLMMGVMRSL